MEGLSMTIEQFEEDVPEMDHEDDWNRPGVVILGDIRRPRFKDMSRNGMVLEYSCGPRWFPRNLLITHLNWVDTKDYTVFQERRTPA